MAEGGVAEARSGRLAAMCCPLPLEGLAVEGWGVVQHRGRRGGGGVEPVHMGAGAVRAAVTTLVHWVLTKSRTSARRAFRCPLV